MDDRDTLWILLCIGALAIGQLLHSRMLARLDRDVQFALIVSRETEADRHD